MTALHPDADAARLVAELVDPAHRTDPYSRYALLRRSGPITMPGAPVVVLTSFADCQAVLRDPRARSDRTLATVRSERAVAVLDDLLADLPGSMRSPSFLMLDPPDHTRLRALVSKAFTPRVVAGLRPLVAGLVDDLLDALPAGGGVADLVAGLARPLPVTVICRLLGVPPADDHRFAAWSDALSRSADPMIALTGQLGDDLPAQLATIADLHRYVRELVDRRRAAPADDLISGLIAAEQSGDRLSGDELVSTCVLLLAAGFETTVNLVANGILALLRHPDQLATLRAEPSGAGPVVEEVLRYDPPVQLTVRVVGEPMAVAGTPLAPGTLMVLLLGAAQRDPAAVAEPDRFDPGRPDQRHLAFGLGPHFCVGAALARTEGALALSRFAQRVEAPRLAPGELRYRPALTLRGLSELAVELDGVGPRSLPWPG